MSWATATRRHPAPPKPTFKRPDFPTDQVDWDRLVCIDFETFYDTDYTLSKLSTSEYIRDERFEALMMGVKVGKKKRVVIPGPKIKAFLKTIPWSTHALLCHNTQFDGFILSHHYGVVPAKYYCSLSMARGLHSNEIGAGLDEVSVFYGRGGKLKGSLEQMKGLSYKQLVAQKIYDIGAEYCGVDVDEMFEIFKLMVPQMPRDEMDLIDLTVRMFCDPVLKLDLPRVQAEYDREVERRRVMLTSLVDTSQYTDVLKGKAEKALVGEERDILITKRVVGSNDKFADLLRAEGVEPPRKVSPAWMKKHKDERDDADKYTFAFAKDDEKFVNLPDDVEALSTGLNLAKIADVKKLAARQDRLRALVDCRLAVKSTTNVTRAERFLKAGANGWNLPVGYAYYRAHTGRWGGNNKMNMQNLTRGGELRLSILAAPEHMICTVDSGQIEARVNAWLWGQHDLLESFKAADTWNEKTMGLARGKDRDAYCKFGDSIYGREITKEDKTERFVGKVCVAEGELILTDRGLVPIQDISKLDRLWDGLEWVHHAGVIDQGIKEVITYDGLTATPDHQVFTTCGRIIPLGQAASEMVRLQKTGAGRANLWFSDDHVVADTPRKRLSVRHGALLALWGHEAGLSEQSQERKDDLVPEERSPACTQCGGVRTPIRRDPSSMHQPSESTMGELRWAGHQVHVQDPNELHPLGVEEPASPELQGGGDRPNRQRRALQPQEFAARDTNATEPQQASVGLRSDSNRACAHLGVEEPVLSNGHLSTGQTRDDCYTDHSGGEICSDRQAEELASYRRTARVYDIANAGPRFRFTASNALVLNCVLGLGYQMGAAKLQITLAKGALGGPPVFFELDKCQAIINTYRRQNHKIRDGWEVCKQIIADMAIGREGRHGPISWEKETIWLPNGMSLKYPDLQTRLNDQGWDEWTYASGTIRKKIYGGLLCENLVQALARIIVGKQMLDISRKYRVVMTTHDEVSTHVKKAAAPKALDFMQKVMRTPLEWCPDIPLNCEGGYDVNYSK